VDPKHFVMSRYYGYRSGTPEGDSESRQILETLFSSFSNHLVAVVLKITSLNGERPTGRNVSPGFLLVCRGRWFYLTAGHIFKRIEEAVTNGTIRVESAFFVDYFGPKAKSRTILRFGFDDLPRYHVDDEELGLDVGVIELSPYYVRLFEANGIVPVTEKNWGADDLSRYQGFFVLGFPEELHGESFTYGSNPIMEPTLIPLQRIPEPPSEITKGRKTLFCANFPEKLPVGLEGASGGPIFGVTRGPGPEFEYQIVAMQFAQVEAQRVAIGCAMPVIGYLMTKWVEQVGA